MAAVVYRNQKSKKGLGEKQNKQTQFNQHRDDID